MRLLKIAIFMFGLAGLNCCSTSKSVVDKSLLSGHWLTTEPDKKPNIILDDSRTMSLLLEDSTTSDTLRYTFKLMGNTMTILADPKHWWSKNKLLKVTMDSLVYKRKGDNEMFHFGRKQGL